MTFTLTIKRVLRASPDDVYATFSDSTRLARVPGVRLSVLETGHSDGTGHLRRIAVGPVVLVERVLLLDSTRREFGYRIEDSRPGFTHQHGLIAVEPHESGSSVTWSTTASVPAGLLTPALEAGGKFGAKAGFHLALILIDRHLATFTTARPRNGS